MEFRNVYEWLAHLRPTSEWTRGSTESLVLNDLLHLDASFHGTHEGQVSLALSWGSLPLLKLGECSVGNCSEEKSSLRIFSNLFIYACLKIIHPSNLALQAFVKTLGFVIEGDTIESVRYEQAFNSIFDVVCSFALQFKDVNTSNLNTGCGGFEVSSNNVQKLPAQTLNETLLIIGPAATEILMRSLATKFTIMCLKFGRFWKEDEFTENAFRISQTSSIPGFWIINSYCPLLSMLKTSNVEISNEFTKTRVDKALDQALSFQQLHCIVQLRHVVNVCPHWIEVSLQIDTVRCDVFQLDPNEYGPMPSGVENERHFPAHISLTIVPQNNSDVHLVSLAASSQNPVTEIGKGNAYEGGFEPPQKLSLKLSAISNSSFKINNWGFEQSVINSTGGKMEWTLYDNNSGKAVFTSKPPKMSVLSPRTWFRDRYSKAHRAFTRQGGVVFAGDVYGKPIIWRINKNLVGETFEWVVKGSICLAYLPNTYRTGYAETRFHNFRELVEIPLLQSS